MLKKYKKGENKLNETKKNKIWMVVAIIAIAIVIVLGVILVVNNNGGKERDGVKKIGSKAKKEEVKIVANKVSNLELEEYKNDVFSMKKPKDWKVETGGSGIYYAIRVYDEKDSRNQVFLMLKIQPLLKSNEAKQFWQNYYNMSGNNSQYKLFADSVVLNNPTTEEFYQKFDDISSFIKSLDPSFSTINFPKFSNFSKLEESESSASMKSVALDSKVLRAKFNDEKGNAGEGMFMASIVNFGNNNLGGVDTLYYMVYDIMAITAVKDEFIDYKDILLQSINSIDFNSAYVQKTIDDGNAQTKQALALNASVQQAFDSYMSAWEKRSTTYDIMSQKQSDATLGYERVYDTETNEIYKAYNGFTDDYDGERYKSITDNMYTEKTSGYIEKIGK